MFDAILRIQRWWRGCLCRIHRLPNVLYVAQMYLVKSRITLTSNEDGRVASCMDERSVIDLLLVRFGDRCKKPAKRHWYDILLFDKRSGWLPVNIKTTRLSKKTADNVGNLSVCVQAYTDYTLEYDTSYTNGKLDDILQEKLKEKQYNRNLSKDYYFIVVNKDNNQDILVNSVRGLSCISKNINNLPFQITWEHNRQYVYHSPKNAIKKYISMFTRNDLPWTIRHLNGMHAIATS